MGIFSFGLWKTQHILKYCMLSFQLSIIGVHRNSVPAG